MTPLDVADVSWRSFASRRRARKLAKLALAVASLLVALLLPAIAGADVVCSTPVMGCSTAAGVSLSGTNAWTGANSFWDTLFTVVDDGDNTKKLAFQLSGVSTGTTRTLTVPNVSSTLCVAGADCAYSVVQTFSTTALASQGGYYVGPSGGNNALIRYGTEQTPDTTLLLTGSLSNNFVIAELADVTFDFAHGAATNPTLFIHSANQNTTQWLGATHDGTNGVISVGTGALTVPGNLNTAAVALTTQIAGTDWFSCQNNANPVGCNIATAKYLGWGGGAITSSPDLSLSRDSAATLQLGVDVNAAAVNQTIKAHDGITGTDILGAKLSLESGLGTGAAVSNPLTSNRQITKASGTSAQTYAPAIIVCPSKLLSTASTATTTVATITTATTSGGNVTVDYGVLACSGSTCDADGGLVKVAWNNNAGTVAAAMTAIALQADSDATGNITSGPTVTVATNVVSIKVTPVFTTIVPTSVVFTATYTVHTAGDTVACQ